MSLASGIALQVRDSRLLTLHFELNRTFAAEQEVQLATNVSITHNYFDDEQGRPALRLFLKVLLQGEGAPLRAEVEMGGVFGLSRKPVDAGEAIRVAEIEAATILFPYLRETVADLSRRGGLLPLHLPPIDFVEFFNRNRAAR